MARRRHKRRTHLAVRNGPGQDNAQSASSSAARVPRSMVIRVGAGEVGPSVSQLVKDVRQMMGPHTASRLRERRSNRLRDYTTMAGPLGVSHLLLFSRSESGNVNLRLALTPRGPTMHFRVENYSLCKDVKKAMRRPAGTSNEFMAPPLLVMNNFVTPKSEVAPQNVPKHLESLSTSVFQSLFPAISPSTTPLASIQRVLLLNRETPKSSQSQDPYVIDLRHYAIGTKRTGLPKAIRRINAAEKVLTDSSKRKKGVPDLGRLTDVADYLLDPTSANGFISGSESEPESDAEVEMLEMQARKVSSKKKPDGSAKKVDTEPRVEKRAVKLSELGPRLRLRLMKVEEGVCTGKVMWHETIKKTKEEERAQEKAWDERKRLKEERKKQQKENVAAKRKVKGGDGSGNDEGDEFDDGDWNSEDLEDDSADEKDEGMNSKDFSEMSRHVKELGESDLGSQDKEDEMEEDQST